MAMIQRGVDVFDDSVLDDPARLVELDTGRLLRAAAMAGAQARSCAEVALEADIDQLADFRPRSVVLLSRPGVSQAVSQLLAALLTPVCPVPVVVSELIPGWVGALDVVCAHTDDPADESLAESIYRADRVGARIVLTAPENGPVAAAAAGHAILLPPRVPVPPGFGFVRALVAGLLMARSLRLADVDPDLLADELDREAERTHPGQEPFVNPAKSLALRLADRAPLLWGLDHVATAVGSYAAFTLASASGQVCDVASFPHAMTRPALARSASRTGSVEELFADPEENAQELIRVFLLAIGTGRATEVARQAALAAVPGADVLAPADEVSGGEAIRAAVLALRFDLAALYSGLASGTIGNQGFRSFQ